MKLFRRWGTNEPRGEGTPPPASEGAPAAEPPEQNGPETPTGDRGIPSVNRVRSVQSRVSSLLAIMLMSALGVGMLGWYYGRALSRSSESHERAQAASRARAQGEMPLPPLGAFEPPPPPTSLTEPTDAATATPRPSGPAGPPTKSPGELAFERRLRGPAFARQSGPNAGPTSSTPPGAETLESGGSPAGAESLASNTSSDSGSLGSLLQPTAARAVHAEVLPTRQLLLPKGAFIDCTLETAIDSTLPGMTTCITATDTFSADGQVVLFERGTKLVGETRGDVRRGSARVFVVWSEARTPRGVVVPLTSPGTDELGRSGLPGQVNRHFWERFSAAILVSVIDSAAQAAAQSRSSDGGTVIYNPSRTTDVLTEILRGTINLPPTVVKHQGDRIQVFVARDVDFRSVYELRARTDH